MDKILGYGPRDTSSILAQPAKLIQEGDFMFSLYMKIYTLDKHLQPRPFYDSEGRWQFYPLTLSQLNKMRPIDFHFTEWLKIEDNIDITNEKFLRRYFRLTKMFVSKDSLFIPYEKIVDIDILDNYSVNILKIVNDETGEVVNMKPIFDKYIQRKRQMFWERCNRDTLLRSPRTTQEMRMKLTPQEKKEYKEYGITVKERCKRSKCNLPSAYDDILIHYDKSWKSHSRQKRQDKRHSKSKRQKLFGKNKSSFMLMV